MTRSRPFLLALLLSLVLAPSLVAAKTPIAPLSERLGDLAYDDYGASAAKGADASLVVWVNEPTVYPENGSVYGRIVGAGQESSRSFLIRGRATSPKVAWNGHAWLVVYGVPNSRFNVSEYDNVAMRTVNRDGTLGPERYINRSANNFPEVSNVVWTGDHWLTLFEKSRVASFDAELNQIGTMLDLPGQTGASTLVQVGGSWYVIRVVDGVAEATEIVEQTIGRSFRITVPDSLQVAGATSDGTVARIVFSLGPDILSASFSSIAGWSEPAVVITDARIVSVASFDGGTLVLHAKPGSSAARSSLLATLIDSSGSVTNQATLLSDEQLRDASLFEDVQGKPILLFSSPRAAETIRRTGSAVFAFPLDSLHSLDGETPELISLTNFASQSRPLIASAGSYAVAFWNQTVDDAGNVSAFSRRIDASGTFLSEPVQLTFTIGNKPEIDFGAGQFFLAWDQSVVTVSVDGEHAGSVTHLPDAYGIDIAAGGGGGFAVWSSLANQLTGTPIRADGSAEVPAGFPLLPSLRNQTHASIARAGDHFRLLWWEEDRLGDAPISPAGTVQELHTEHSSEPDEIQFAGNDQGSLAVWTTFQKDLIDLAFGLTGGSVGVDVRRVGADHAAVAPDGTGFKVAFSGAGRIWSSDVTVQGGFVTGFSTPQFLTTGVPVGDLGLAVVDQSPLTVWEEDGRVWLGDEQLSGRTRPVR